jgi:preprotein translocase subunit SecF
MLQIFKSPQYDIIGKRKFAYVFSLALILIGVISIFFHHGLKYGIDFTGGTLLQIHVDKPVDTGTLRSIVSKAGIPDAEIQEFGTLGDFLIKYKEEVEVSKVKEAIEKELKAKVEVHRTERVGPRIGHELQRKAIMAILVGLVLMLIYITFRFDLRFGIGAVLALFHDVFITLGFLSIFNMDIDIPIIAALLTIVGYSINDSIVVSDRIRENVKKLGKKFPITKFVETVNRSINETLSRTVITSLTTVLVLVAILLFGGPVIFDFAFALTIGVVIGTYSSIFVVAALVVDWATFRSRKRSR